MGFERICLLGVGLMGGSVGLACRHHLGHAKIIGYSPRPEELQRAVDRQAIHIAAQTAAEAVADADLVILCTPVGLFGETLRSIAPALKAGAIITDVGSTKRSVVAAAGSILPASVRFVGSHPMAGGEKHGVENARESLLTGALCILTPTPATDPAAVQQLEKFWQSLNMRTVCMSPEVHDRLTADISHLPHAIAAAVVRIQSPQSLQLAARGFLDTTRIAAGDCGLWSDILLENRDNLRAGILRLQQHLQLLLDHLESHDDRAVRDWLTVAAQTRGSLGNSTDEAGK